MTPSRLAAALLLMVAALSPASADAPALRIAAPATRPGQAGGLSGFEADLAAAICHRVPAKCEVVTAARGGDPLAPLLQAKADAVIAGLSVSPESQRRIDFSRAYASLSHGFIVMKAGRFGDLPGAGDTLSLDMNPGDATAMIAALRAAFAGRTIAAAPGTPDRAFLVAHFGDIATVPDYRTGDAFERDLAAGKIDAVMAPVIDLPSLAARPAYRDLVPAGPRFYADGILGFELAVGVRKADRVPHDMVDRAIDDMIRDGSLERLSRKWFAMDITPHRCFCKPF
jgi:octopine/nopaline transport system substrate-binding protein